MKVNTRFFLACLTLIFSLYSDKTMSHGLPLPLPEPAVSIRTPAVNQIPRSSELDDRDDHVIALRDYMENVQQLGGSPYQRSLFKRKLVARGDKDGLTSQLKSGSSGFIFLPVATAPSGSKKGKGQAAPIRQTMFINIEAPPGGSVEEEDNDDDASGEKEKPCKKNKNKGEDKAGSGGLPEDGSLENAYDEGSQKGGLAGGEEMMNGAMGGGMDHSMSGSIGAGTDQGASGEGPNGFDPSLSASQAQGGDSYGGLGGVMHGSGAEMGSQPPMQPGSGMYDDPHASLGQDQGQKQGDDMSADPYGVPSHGSDPALNDPWSDPYATGHSAPPSGSPALGMKPPGSHSRPPSSAPPYESQLDNFAPSGSPFSDPYAMPADGAPVDSHSPPGGMSDTLQPPPGMDGPNHKKIVFKPLSSSDAEGSSGSAAATGKGLVDSAIDPTRNPDAGWAGQDSLDAGGYGDAGLDGSAAPPSCGKNGSKHGCKHKDTAPPDGVMRTDVYGAEGDPTGDGSDMTLNEPPSGLHGGADHPFMEVPPGSSADGAVPPPLAGLSTGGIAGKDYFIYPVQDDKKTIDLKKGDMVAYVDQGASNAAAPPLPNSLDQGTSMDSSDFVDPTYDPGQAIASQGPHGSAKHSPPNFKRSHPRMWNSERREAMQKREQILSQRASTWFYRRSKGKRDVAIGYWKGQKMDANA